MLLAKPVVVVSPLLALLEDQTKNLDKRGVPVVRVDGTIRGKARKEAMERIAKGGPLLVMTTPETLAGEELRLALMETGISLFAVDEAHCASEWGHDFRPAYLRLREMLERYGRPPVLAVTATATTSVREDLVRILDLDDPLVIVASPHRANLCFEVIECGSTARLRALTRLVLRLRRPGIVYCSTTREVDAVWGALKAMGVPAHRYHGGMKGSDRKAEQELFMKRGRRLVMVATSAFGLGIDKPDIRYVVHFQTPASLEQYVQEAGRAGRDGRPSHCILLHHCDDRQIHEFLQSQSRVRSAQLFQLVKGLAAYVEEGRFPDIVDLAASSQLAQRVTSAVVALLESAGLVELTTEKYVRPLIPPDELMVRARHLTEQFIRLSKLDTERLDCVEQYGESNSCRAQLLRDYFGVDPGDPCEVCDVCMQSGERPGSFFEPLRKKKAKKKAKKSAKKGRRSSKARKDRPAKRGRRRGARGRGRGGRQPGGGGGQEQRSVES
jgi:ATP-dependent DNA helicase RecQ